MGEVPRDVAISDMEMNGRVYAKCVRSSMTYGSETRPLLFDVGLKFERAEMHMIRWMCGISMKDRRTNEELGRLAGVESIGTVIRSGRLRWYGHVMRKGDEDRVKKCIEFRVEGSRPVGRPRRTWLQSVEADMAEQFGLWELVHLLWLRNINKEGMAMLGMAMLGMKYDRNVWKKTFVARIQEYGRRQEDFFRDK